MNQSNPQAIKEQGEGHSKLKVEGRVGPKALGQEG